MPSLRRTTIGFFVIELRVSIASSLRDFSRLAVLASVRHSYVTVWQRRDADPTLLRSPEQMAEALTRTAPEALSAGGPRNN